MGVKREVNMLKITNIETLNLKSEGRRRTVGDAQD
jgi:hypothetical protein